jgi:translation initiation factor IF-3
VFRAHELPFRHILLYIVSTNALDTTRINQQIRAAELRVLGPEGENLGVLPLSEALAQAKSFELDLIEVSPNAVPPVAKIMEYGKFQYEQEKRRREIKAKSHTTETKSVQVKIGTGENDMILKAKRAAQWLGEGHRVKVDLFLWGRYKYMEFAFLKERLERFLKMIPAEYRLADPIAKSPKGLSTVIEKVAKGK